MPAEEDTEAWRAQFVGFYLQREPSKVGLVSNAMMGKWKGRCSTLFRKMELRRGRSDCCVVAPGRGAAAVWGCSSVSAGPPPPLGGAGAREEWRARFVAFHEAHAPAKVELVDDAMALKWAGRHDVLHGKLTAKHIKSPDGSGRPSGQTYQKPRRKCRSYRRGRSAASRFMSS
jgi:hypothetical protein